jgi:hypothetical protein
MLSPVQAPIWDDYLFRHLQPREDSLRDFVYYWNHLQAERIYCCVRSGQFDKLSQLEEEFLQINLVHGTITINEVGGQHIRCAFVRIQLRILSDRVMDEKDGIIFTEVVVC